MLDLFNTAALILLFVWALGLVGSYTMGGLIHLLFFAAIILVAVGVVQRRRARAP
jgi:hypothetical protein